MHTTSPFRPRPRHYHHAPHLALPATLALVILLASQPPLVAASATCPVRLPDAPRIVNGDIATTAVRRHLVALGIRGFFSDFSFTCSGTLLTRTHILTAAHCVPSVFDTPLALLNTNATSFGNSVSVRRYIRHPRFSPTAAGSRFDIAVVELDVPAPLEALDTAVNVVAAVPESTSFARAVGFGLTRAGTKPLDNILRQVDLPVNSNEECREAYAGTLDATDTDYHVCAGYLSTGACSPCNGDSGGPLLQYKGSVPVVVGVVSRGPANCGEPDIPAVFVRTSVFEEWLDENVPGLKKESGITTGAVVADTDGDGMLSTAAIVGIAVGSSVAVAVLIILLWVCVCRRRKSRETSVEQTTPQEPTAPAPVAVMPPPMAPQPMATQPMAPQPMAPPPMGLPPMTPPMMVSSPPLVPPMGLPPPTPPRPPMMQTPPTTPPPPTTQPPHTTLPL